MVLDAQCGILKMCSLLLAFSSHKTLGQNLSPGSDGAQSLDPYIIVCILLITLLFLGTFLVINVTKRKAVEFELQQLKSQSSLDLLINYLPMGIAVLGADNSVEALNQSFSDILGYTREDIKDYEHGWAVLVPDKKYRSSIRQRWDYVTSQVLEHNIGMEAIEVRVVSKNGVELTTEVTFVPMSGGRSLIVFYDITASKVAESDLRESEELFAAFMDHLPGVASLKNDKGEFLYINRNGVKNSCFNYRDPLRKTVDSFFDKATADEIHRDEELALEIGSVSATRFFKGSDEAGRWFDERYFKIERANRSPLIGELTFDITDKKNIEEQLLQAQKMETVGNLAGGLAHDFNNILGGIKGALSMITFVIGNEESIPSDKIINYVDLAENSTDRAADLVTQLLTFSKKHEMNFAPVELKTIINDVQKVCRTTFPKAVEFDIDLPKLEAVVTADSAQLYQVILNLCINASHAMTIMREPGVNHGGTLSLSLIRFRADEKFTEAHTESNLIDYWVLNIKDTGVGIDTEIQNRIFDPFFSTKDKSNGSGLGLTMVYNIVTEHKGFIDINSVPGSGTMFSVFLPALDSFEESGNEKRGAVQDIVRGRGTILVIDDEEIIRVATKNILETCGYEVILAKNGIEGIAIYSERSASIDVVMLDMCMPKISGKDTYIKLCEINKDVKVLMNSGFKQDQRVLDSLALGVDDFIQKPFSMHELSVKVKSVLTS